MREVAEDAGRARQRRRTRAGIVDAAARLLAAGGPAPGVSEIAEAAEVSRRTVYQYFPTVDQLLLDATLGLLSQSGVDAAIDAAAGRGADAVERVEAMIRAIGEMAATTMPLGRSLIRLTVDAPAQGAQPKRGYRRIGWIERAVDPLRGELDPDLFEQLVSGLAMVVGWEAFIVLQDLRGLDAGETARVSSWAAQALVGAALDEQQARPAAG
ncbi:MAG TPA: TetR family transcriptional regulator [Mycobacteriales bacterium]|jgi:AcrR family transcriptional regulator|nr:TetR family transcriptional regulator [Mycobacteriales bacterium]